MEKIVWPVIGCKPRPAILAKLAGSTDTIETGGAHPALLSLPLLPYESIPTVRAGATPTSGGVVLPAQW
jgi:hypothetical protein